MTDSASVGGTIRQSREPPTRNDGICALGGGLGRFASRVDATSPQLEISAITGEVTP